MNQTDMRLDPLRQTWTVFSAARASRPTLPPRRKKDRVFSPFVAGQEHFTPAAVYEKRSGDRWQVRVIPNRAPALRVEGDTQRRAEGFYDRMDGVGAHEIIVETPDDRSIEDLSLPELGAVIVAWKTRMLDLMRDVRMRAFFVIKNSGEAAGEQVPHSVSQLVAMALIPLGLQQKLDVAREFYERKKRSIFEDILAEEVRTATRLVYENNGFAVFCPYASRTPFELALYPKRQCADFHGVTDQEVAQLSDALKTALLKLNGALDHPAYNLMLSTAPTRTSRHDHWNTLESDFRWHIEITPRLFPVGGFELGTGCHLNTVRPETAAEYLRKIDV
jgi:UDPglucose--hexose-1-phosphate uridylyltransferase